MLTTPLKLVEKKFISFVFRDIHWKMFWEREAQVSRNLKVENREEGQERWGASDRLIENRRKKELPPQRSCQHPVDWCWGCDFFLLSFSATESNRTNHLITKANWFPPLPRHCHLSRFYWFIHKTMKMSNVKSKTDLKTKHNTIYCPHCHFGEPPCSSGWMFLSIPTTGCSSST